MMMASRLARTRNAPSVPLKVKAQKNTIDDMDEHMRNMGIDASAAVERMKATSRKRSRAEALPDEAVKEANAEVRGEAMDIEMANQGFRNVKVMYHNIFDRVSTIC